VVSHPFLGQTERLRVEFTDFSGDPIDPATVTLRILKPDGTLVTYDSSSGVTNDPTPTEGDGVFYRDTLMDQVGDWQIRWESTGGLNPVTQYVVGVRPYPFTGTAVIGLQDSSPAQPA